MWNHGVTELPHPGVAFPPGLPGLGRPLAGRQLGRISCKHRPDRRLVLCNVTLFTSKQKVYLEPGAQARDVVVAFKS